MLKVLEIYKNFPIQILVFST